MVVDRLVRGSEAPGRRLDSIETAFAKGLGRCRVVADDGGPLTFYEGWRCGRLRAATTPSPTPACSATTARSGPARRARGSAG